MDWKYFQKGALKLSVGLTRCLPRDGAKILDGVLYPLLGNSWLVEGLRKANQRKLSRLSSFKRLLVISDIHIGDAVLMQTAVSALRDFFPDAGIDYMVKKSAACLLEGQPDISELWPAFTGGRLPDPSDIRNAKEMSLEYDMVFNFCPFFEPDFFPEKNKVFHFLSYAADFARNEWKGAGINHISYQAHRFIYDLFHPLFSVQRGRPFEGPGLFLAPEAISQARIFMEQKAGLDDRPLVFVNPETASPYTQVPFHYLSSLLEGLVELPCRILLGEGHSNSPLAEQLRYSIPIWKRDRVIIVPREMPLDAYAALIDWSDIFVSGDTGPLHLAAAWKKSQKGGHVFRNRTAVIGIFGATPPRLSGYDSFRWDFLETEQKSWSLTYQSESACRNITCFHKMAKNCDPRGCFRGLDWVRILSDIKGLLPKTSTLSLREALPSSRTPPGSAGSVFRPA